MKFFRYVSPVLALFAFIFLYERLIHGYVLVGMYEATSEVWRDFAKMESMMPLALSYQLALAAWSVFIFSRIYPEGGVQKGLTFGLFFGVFAGILTSSWYLWLNVPAQLGLGWFFYSIGEGVGGGSSIGHDLLHYNGEYMKRFFLSFCLLFAMSVFAEEFTHEDLIERFCEDVFELSGVDDLDEFEFRRDFAFNSKISAEQKRELLEKVSQDMDKYPPSVIFSCGLTYLALNDFKKAASYMVGAACRIEIDVRLDGDRSLKHLSSLCEEMINETIMLFPDAQVQELQEEMKAARLNFEKWDRAITWDYVIRDDDLTDEERALIISRFYKECVTPNEISPGEDFQASETDLFYFDRESRMYYVNDALEGTKAPTRQFSFHVPDSIMPKLDPFGEYDGNFKLSSAGILAISYHWSKMHDDLFNFEYEQACSGYEYVEGEVLEHTVQKSTLYGVPAFQVKTSYKDKNDVRFIQTSTCFQIGNTCYSIQAHYSLEDEQLCAKEVEEFLKSFKRL